MYCSGTLWFYFGNDLNGSQKLLKEMLKAFLGKWIQVIHIFMNPKVDECQLFHRQQEILILHTRAFSRRMYPLPYEFSDHKLAIISILH